MKIAVCFSGEPRTWKNAVKSIQSFYSGPHEFYFFGHIWANNTPGNHHAFPEPEYLDIETLRTELQDALRFTDLLVEHHRTEPNFQEYHQYIFPDEDDFGKKKTLNTTIPITWRSPFYSAMRSNNLKYACEMRNDMHFDVVVRARLDVCYTPGVTIAKYLPLVLQPHALYCSTNYFKREYMMPCINDVFYFGSSDTMDIIDTFYRVYHNGDFFKMLNCDYFDGGYKSIGPGAMLYKWASMKNVLPIHTPFDQMPVIRKTAESLVWPGDFAQIMEKYTTW
jgi:hypothetical protein